MLVDEPDRLAGVNHLSGTEKTPTGRGRCRMDTLPVVPNFAAERAREVLKKRDGITPQRKKRKKTGTKTYRQVYLPEKHKKRKNQKSNFT